MVVFFDIDGTLMDHDMAERAGAIAIHQAIGSCTPIDPFLSKWSIALERHFSRYVKGEITYVEQGRARVHEVSDVTFSDATADRIFSEYLAAYERAWSLFPDVLSCLDELSEHRLGVISNGRASEQRRKLLVHGIERRFALVLISEEWGWAKPSREIFLQACAMSRETPANVVYIGDCYELDACAARRAGVSGVWLDRRGRAAAHHLPPVIKTLAEFPALLSLT